MSRKGGIYWAKITRDNVPHLALWSDVVLNDAQIAGPENEVTDPAGEIVRYADVAGLPRPRIWYSINMLTFFIDDRYNTSVYWPMQGRIAACPAWLYSYSSPVTESLPWGRVAYLDMSNAALNKVFAEEMVGASRTPNIHGIFLDEAHRTIADVRGRHPGITVTDAAWQRGVARTLRNYAQMMGGRPLPIITNGTFGREESAIVSGRFWQAVQTVDIPAKVLDAEGARYTMLHGCAGTATPENLASACRAIERAGGEACYQWTARNGDWTAAVIP